MILVSERIKARALALGFNLVGITPARPSPHLAAYLRWIEQGMHASMGYLARPDRVQRRQHLQSILPAAQSIIIVGMDYASDLPPHIAQDPSRGRIARYAWGVDYHDVLGERLERFAGWLGGESGQHRVYVDTGAILERSHAQQAGLGFIGKNTMLIHPRRGSYFFLGEIITTLAADRYDEPSRPTMCGVCQRCLSACPTDAFPQPHVLDARRCISYHTIENKGWIDPHLRGAFGNWVFGCDICQEVCPFQRFAPPAAEVAFCPADWDRVAPPLADLLSLDEVQFAERYHGTPIYRIKRARLARNACVAAGNSGDSDLIPLLERLLDDPSAIVRGHALWALGRLGAPRLSALCDRYSYDPDEGVRAEALAILNAR